MVKLVLRNNIRQRVPYLNERNDMTPSIVNQTETPATGLTNTEREAIAITREQGRVTTKTPAAKTGVSGKTASKTLKDLASQHIYPSLAWIGST